MTCINLRDMFGDRFKVTYDKAYHAEHGERGRTIDTWLMVVPCRYGHIFPYGGAQLAAFTGGKKTMNRLAKLDCCRVLQHGDGEMVVTLDVKDAETVFGILKPRRRRRLGDDHKKKLVAAGKVALQRHRARLAGKEF